MTYAHYRGDALAITNLMGGSVDTMFATLPNMLLHMASGKLTAIALANGSSGRYRSCSTIRVSRSNASRAEVAAGSTHTVTSRSLASSGHSVDRNLSWPNDRLQRYR